MIPGSALGGRVATCTDAAVAPEAADSSSGLQFRQGLTVDPGRPSVGANDVCPAAGAFEQPHLDMRIEARDRNTAAVGCGPRGHPPSGARCVGRQDRPGGTGAVGLAVDTVGPGAGRAGRLTWAGGASGTGGRNPVMAWPSTQPDHPLEQTMCAHLPARSSSCNSTPASRRATGFPAAPAADVLGPVGPSRQIRGQVLGDLHIDLPVRAGDCLHRYPEACVQCRGQRAAVEAARWRVEPLVDRGRRWMMPVHNQPDGLVGVDCAVGPDRESAAADAWWKAPFGANRGTLGS
jgi:hypothetical protein